MDDATVEATISMLLLGKGFNMLDLKILSKQITVLRVYENGIKCQK